MHAIAITEKKKNNQQLFAQRQLFGTAFVYLVNRRKSPIYLIV